MRHLFTIVLLFFIINLSFTQEDTPNEIRSQMDSIDALIHIGDYQNAYGQLVNLIPEVEKSNKRPYLQELYLFLGKILVSRGELSKADSIYKTGINLQFESDEIDIKKQVLWTEKLKMKLAEVYARQGQYIKAAESFRESLKYAEKENQRFMILDANDMLANINIELQDTVACIEHLENALIESDFLKVPNQQISIRAKLFDIMVDMGQDEKALMYLKEARKLLSEKGDEVSLDFYYMVDYVTGEYFTRKENYDSAYFYYKKAYDVVSAIAPPEYVAIDPINLGLAASLVNIGRFEEGINQVSPYIEAVEKYGDPTGIVEGKNILATAYENMGNYKAAYENYKKVTLIIDSLRKEENLIEVTRIQSEAEFDKERLIAANEQKILRAEANTNRAIAGGVGLLALALLGFFYNARRNNKIIAEKNGQLETLNTTKDRIFAIIGHDLRKPAIGFRSISKVINYLLDNKDYTTLQKVGKEVERDALALYKLTDNLLSWALMQKDVMPYHPKAVPAQSIAEETLTVFQRVAADKNIKLTSNIPEDLTVFADANALATIVRNLTDNALKYTPEGGTVTLNAEESEAGVKIIVEDSGVGMPPEKVEDIFMLKKDKSERGTSGEKGTGIGLHLIHELVKMNHGKVNVNSTIGQGTTFTVLLPKQQLQIT